MRASLGQPRSQRVEQFEFPQQMRHRGGLAARNHQRVDGVEFTAASDGDRVGAGFAQRRKVFAGVALQREHSDARVRSLSASGVKSRL